MIKYKNTEYKMINFILLMGKIFMYLITKLEIQFLIYIAYNIIIQVLCIDTKQY